MNQSIPIVALDVSTGADALRMTSDLGELCRFYKVGNALFTAEGPDVVRAIRDTGADVFLDLKYHDIPNTVGHAVRSAVSLGVRLLTVHTSGGAAMLLAAREAAGDACGVLGVTILTSLDSVAVASAWGRDAVSMDDEVLRLAAAAAQAGLHGIVCSGFEAKAVKALHGNELALLVPGIRLAGDPAGDQQRVMTPQEAQRAGASYLVLGRSVTAAGDPRGAMAKVLAELGGGMT